MSYPFLLSKCLAGIMLFPDRYREYFTFGVSRCGILARVDSSAFPSNIQLHLGRVLSLSGSPRRQLMSAPRHDILSLEFLKRFPDPFAFLRLVMTMIAIIWAMRTVTSTNTPHPFPSFPFDKHNRSLPVFRISCQTAFQCPTLI
jgi:hypothetical protein